MAIRLFIPLTLEDTGFYHVKMLMISTSQVRYSMHLQMCGVYYINCIIIFSHTFYEKNLELHITQHSLVRQCP